jgi:putative addiction module component (TIGR02574 family)
MSTPTIEQLKASLAELPAAERAELAQYLLRSLDAEEDGADAEWLALAEQRMADVRAGRVVGIPAEDVLKSLPGAGK